MSSLSFDPTRGPARERIDAQELEDLRAARAIVRDGRRERPLYFDGRFLAARDLVRDQTHTLLRLADVGRAIGAGVVAGLDVTWQVGTSRVTISPGHGITPAGDQVVVRPEGGDGLHVNLVDVPRIQNLNLAFGLSRLPHPLIRSLDGTFLLVLRPVEFTSNPIAAYPTSVDGERSVTDGEVIEATAVALVPYPTLRRDEDLKGDTARAELARDVFHLGTERGSPAQVLPLAVVYLAAGRVKWVDVHLARREAGRDPGDLLSFGESERALRDAWLRQYAEQLAGVTLPAGSTLAASEWFAALPPAGPLPKEALDPKTITQTWFPAQIDTEIAIVPEDELPALVEEALILPGIDLRAEPGDLESTAVLVLLPVARQRIGALRAELAASERHAGMLDVDEGRLPAWDPGRRVALSRIQGRLTIRRPIDRLRALSQPRRLVPNFHFVPTIAAPPSVEKLWERALEQASVLWYVRRRNVERRLELLGRELEVAGTDVEAEAAFDKAVLSSGKKTAWDALKKRMSTRARGLVYARAFKYPSMLRSSLLVRGMVDELDQGSAERTLELQDVRRTLDRFAHPGVGTGLESLTAASEDLRKQSFTRAKIPLDDVLRLDALAGKMDAERVAELAARVVEKVAEGEPDRLAERLRELVGEFDRGRDVVGRLRGLGVRLGAGTLSVGEAERRRTLELLGSTLERGSSRILGSLVADAVARPPAGEEAGPERAERIERIEEDLGADAELGRGLEAVERSDPTFREPAVVETLARPEVAFELDRLVRELPEERRSVFIRDLRTAVTRERNVERVTELIARARRGEQ